MSETDNKKNGSPDDSIASGNTDSNKHLSDSATYKADRTSGYLDTDIDDFAKALLDKKTEMAIYAETAAVTDTENTEIAQKIKEQKEAEGTMADALDELRRERGQLPIDQEEENFAWSRGVSFEDRFQMDSDDFTTESLFHHTQPSSRTTMISGYDPEEQKNYIEETEKRPVASGKIRSRSSRNRSRNVKPEVPAESVSEKNSDTVSESVSSVAEAKNIPMYVPEQDNSVQTDAEKEPVIQSVYVEQQKEEPKKNRSWIWILLLIVILLLGGGWLYKTQIYDPDHTITEAMQADVDALKKDADGWSTMTDAQKQEVADKNIFGSLNTASKDAVNAYFKEKTGQTYSELIAALSPADNTDKKEDSTSDKTTDQTEPDSSKPDSEAENGNNAEDQNSSSPSQSPTSQNPTVPDAAVPGTDSTIQNGNTDTSTPVQTPSQTPSQNVTQPAEQTPVQNPGTTDANAAQIRAYQQEIAQLQQDKSNYVNFLASEGLPTSDDITASYDAQIAYYQNLLNALQ